MLVDKEYVIKIRRLIHEYPEVGFDLDRTVALVKSELDSMNIEHTEKYGKGSVVGTLNPELDNFTIGIRADMDALLIDEKNDIPFKSKNQGVMHACGHDAHTAMLLGTAKALSTMRDKIKCRVKFIFQPSEEGIKSGAEMMVNNGVMDDIDIIIGLHVENSLPSGKIGVCSGPSMASSRSFKIDFYGKSAHATLPQSGVDALAIAVRTYSDIQFMLSRELSPFSKRVCSIGKLCGGTSQNIVADHAYMLGTIRAFDMDTDKYIIDRITSIANANASQVGARAEVDTSLKAFVLYNDTYLSELVIKSAKNALGDSGVVEMKEKLSSEDFSQYVTKKPGVFFRLGTRNEQKGYVTLPHNNDFMIDEDALVNGSETCVRFVLDNMNGIDKDKLDR